MTKLFITGATGYIGGDALYAIASAYPNLSITAMVRNSDKGAKVASQYPKIRLVYGNLDSTELITTEASKADIVLHCAHADHEGSANAIVAGIAQKEGKPGYFIHTSGTGILSYADYEIKSYGNYNEKIYDDWDNIEDVTKRIPVTAIHKNVDDIVLAAGTQHPGKIFTAIVAPPCIWGPGRGPDNQKSIQIYTMTRAILKRGIGFHVGEGKNVWTEVHVQDLSNVFVALVNAALEDGGKATWNDEGYYFAENGDILWGEVATTITKIAYEKKLINSPNVDNVSPEKADEMQKSGSYLWGMNSRCRAIRARKLLTWEPKQKSVLQSLPEIVDGEARGLGRTKGHAAQASGEHGISDVGVRS
ncbi:NAD(P)-binding protein [Pleomassaria siparia CBS 279.74]|uniref:NAD(P)-binding protein n=1 Tax=Pleomassaria siparia CBS 279.74 TaxID=1314801 RepID=A0A6G1KQ31_9PLEO|nr:NAD(P)-binding protein [Pleomassaria siparia CBS 279.74]